MKTKTYLFVLALPLLLLAGCQKDELVNSQKAGNPAVNYAVATGRPAQSRSADRTVQETSGEASGAEFVLKDAAGSLSIPMVCEVTEGICADAAPALTRGTLVNTSGDDYKTLSEFTQTVTEFIAGAYDGGGTQKASQTVTWSGSAWEATPTAYWPQNTALSFLAYANLPGEQTATIASTGVTTFHTVPATASEQTDILFGNYSGNGGNTGTAEIRFDHPLTAVIFKLGGIDEEYAIQSISLSGVAESGIAKKVPDGIITWTGVDTYDYTVSQSDDSGLSVDATTSVIGEPFLIIPQNLADNNVTVTVTFTNDVILEAIINSGEWKAGYTNTYTFSMIEESLEVQVKEDFNGTVKGNLGAKNTGNATEFIRALIVTNWVDDAGRIVSSVDFTTNGTITGYLEDGCNWVKHTDGYYYYTKAVKGGSTTEGKIFTSYAPPSSPANVLQLEMTVVVQCVEYDSSCAKAKSAWGDDIPLSGTIE